MLDELFHRMFQAFGPQHWWPGESRLEIIVGAVLTQNTSWKNVELAIANLRTAKTLSLEALYAIKPVELEPLLRPAGYYRVKTKRLKNVISHIVEHYGNLDSMFDSELPKLRRELLKVNGIGPESADAILLYAGGKPTFVIDAYTGRIMKRHGWVGKRAGYDELKHYFESRLEADAQLFNEYHALIVQIGKDYCKPTAQCDECPLRPMLPATGMIDLKD